MAGHPELSDREWSRGGIAFQWQNITPFGIRSASDFLLDPPPALTSKEYAKAYNEVMTVGSINSTQRPPDRANVALYLRGFLANSGIQSGCRADRRAQRPYAVGKRARSSPDQHGDQ